MAGELAFFELGVGDAERGRTFYAGLFGVRELGGEVDDANVEGDAESVARFGRFRLCRDDQGSPFGLHQRPPTG